VGTHPAGVERRLLAAPPDETRDAIPADAQPLYEQPANAASDPDGEDDHVLLSRLWKPA
jgi:hypothetical protein